MNTNPMLSIGGTWAPIDASYLTSTNSGNTVTYAGLIKIGADDNYGVVVSGWGMSGWKAQTAMPEQVNVAILAPDHSGGLTVSTSSYISDCKTNGSGSVIVADFNDDGKEDIFLAAHNESPLIAMPSTAYLSNSSGGFDKVTLNDHLMAHGAELIYLNGKPHVVTQSFTSVDSHPADHNPIFSYENGVFVENLTSSLANVWGGESTAIGSFGGQGQTEVVVGSALNWNATLNKNDPPSISVYSFSENDPTKPTLIQTITPYLSTLPQYANFESDVGIGATEVYRVWKSDLNNDGKPDVLAGGSMWNKNSNTDWPSALQVLINKGDGTFKDMTEVLNPSMSLNQASFDYQPTFVDLDHSGIQTYLFSSFSFNSLERQANYVLLNDGTGRLYAGVHQQLAQVLPKVISYAQQQYPGFYVDTSSFPKFMAVPQSDGSLNFVAMIYGTSVAVAQGNLSHTEYAFVNVPLHYNPTTDFNDNVTINDRNSSTLMRTWAGDDTIYDTGANLVASINGGLGTDKCVYSGAANFYSITRNVDSTTTVKNASLTDTLTSVERLQFSDKSIALDISGNGGQAYRMYQAAFDRKPDIGGLGYWISAMDKGFTLQDVALGFMNSAEFKALYGVNPTNAEFVTRLYNNVLHRAPEQGGFDYWTGLLDSGTLHKENVMTGFSESPENQAQVIGVIQNGMEYIPYS